MGVAFEDASLALSDGGRDGFLGDGLFDERSMVQELRFASRTSAVKEVDDGETSRGFGWVGFWEKDVVADGGLICGALESAVLDANFLELRGERVVPFEGFEMIEVRLLFLREQGEAKEGEEDEEFHEA